MSQRAGILAGGNWIVDKLKSIDVYPQQDALANIISESIGNGGSPFNVLMDLARLGANFPLSGIGLVGQDVEGEWILEQCAAHRIDTARLRDIEGIRTSYTDVMTVQGTGRRTFFHQRGANAFLDVDHFEFGSSDAKIFHLGYLLLLDRLDEPDATYGTKAARVFAMAQQAGFKTSVDVVSEDSRRFADIVVPTLKYVDYCILNEFEAERTTGVEIRHPDGVSRSALEVAARKLLAEGVRHWVVIHFPEGACAMGPDGLLHAQGSLCIPQSEIVGTVGAGDAFAAGVLYGLHEDVPIQDALTYGVCAATSCLKAAGTSDGVLSLQECLRLKDRFGCRPEPGN